MKYVKHQFGFWTNCWSIENPAILFKYYYCKICNQTVEDLFALFDRHYNEFDSAYGQEIWLNEYTPCLTVKEKIIKDLIE